MKKCLCLFLCLCLMLGGCTPPPDTASPSSSDAASSSTSPLPPESSASVQLVIPPEPSCVEELAAEIVAEKNLSVEQGEQAIRALYHHLIETVWFADPVGLDVWRYMTASDLETLPFLENRALSPLLFGIGSCEDFAAAMVLLLRAAGFEAEYVAGFTLSVDQVYIDHAWAVVRLGGRWYHIDPQLEQNVIRSNKLTYRYYLKSDDDYSIDHKWGENLIDYWPDMPEQEKAAIRELYTPPACPQAYSPPPSPVPTLLPLRPDRGELERQIAKIKHESGKKELPAIWLDVEPPILVAEYHITPPLLDQGKPVKVSSFQYGRSFLSGDAAALYDNLPAFLDAMSDQSTLAIGNKLSDPDVLYIIDTFLTEHPTYYWAKLSLVAEGEARYLRLSLRFSPDGIVRQKEEIDTRVRELLAPVEESPPFLRALAIHDALAAIPYDRDENGTHSNDLYGALVENLATCHGYAASFLYLSQQAGLDCALLKGSTLRGIGHAWNAILLDGSWHFVDVTWDRPLQGEDSVYHDFFLMSTAEMMLERKWDEAQYPSLPEPSSGFASYYTRMDYALSGPVTDDATTDISAIIYRQLAAKELSSESRVSFAELRVESSPEDYRAWKEFFVKSLFDIQREVEALSQANGGHVILSDLSSAKCDFNDAMQVLTLYPTIRG